MPAYVLTDELFGKHFSIVGTTGSGKSCVVATILNAVIERNPNAHLMLLDPHSEYSSAFKERAAVLSPGDGLHLPYWLFNFDELVEIVIRSNPNLEQAKILGDAVMAAKQSYFAKAGLDGLGTVDTPAPYRMSDVIRFLDTAMGSLNRPDGVAAYQAVKNRILSLPGGEPKHRKHTRGRQTRARHWDSGGVVDTGHHQGRVVLQERHCIVSAADANREFSKLLRRVREGQSVTITSHGRPVARLVPLSAESRMREAAKQALFRIAKEGRKYGVSLCVVSQRPSDLAPGLLSQCNTMFAFRMTSHEDQDIVRSAVPEASHGLMNFLPALRNGEAIAVGEGVAMPMRICFSLLPDDRRPKSATTSFTSAWSKGSDGTQIERTVERWRRGMRHASG